MNTLDESEFETGGFTTNCGEAFRGRHCGWEPCDQIVDDIIAGRRDHIYPRVSFTSGGLETPDPEELLDMDSSSWLERATNADYAMELFASQGNTAGVLRAAGRLRPVTTSINRLFTLSPYTDELYAAACSLANRAPDIRTRIELNSLIERRRQEDAAEAKKLVLDELERRALRLTGTIFGHGQLPEGTQPALSAGTIGAV